ncbi:MAG: hypothetical protein U0797_08170 [Gemmataceae bacterium]
MNRLPPDRRESDQPAPDDENPPSLGDAKVPKPEDVQGGAANTTPGGRLKILVTLETLEEDARRLRAQGLDIFGFPLGRADVWQEEEAPPVRREVLEPFLKGELDLETHAVVKFLVRYYPNSWGRAATEVFNEIRDKDDQ